jgi:uncharacterized OsmC-like protein
MNIDLTGTTIDLTKSMVADPRRISAVKVIFTFPASLQVSEKDRTILERAAHTCPVAKSLHADIVQEVTFNWNL